MRACAQAEGPGAQAQRAERGLRENDGSPRGNRGQKRRSGLSTTVDSPVRPGTPPPQTPSGQTLHGTAEFRHHGLAGGHFPLSLLCFCHVGQHLRREIMRETQRWTSVCRFHADRILRACALERQSLEVRVPARPLRVGTTVPHVSEGCGSVRGHTWFGWPLLSSVRSRVQSCAWFLPHTQSGPFTGAATPS